MVQQLLAMWTWICGLFAGKNVSVTQNTDYSPNYNFSLIALIEEI